MRKNFLKIIVDDFQPRNVRSRQAPRRRAPRRRNRRSACRSLTTPRPVAACPSSPSASQRGWRGRPLPVRISIRCALHFVGVMSATPPVAEWTTTTTTTLRGAPTSRFALATTPNARRRTTAAAPPPPYASQRAVEGPAAHAWKLDQHPASRPRMRTSKPTPAEPRTPPDRYVRARLRCSSRASLPLTPQAGTPTAIIGMRPATSLRTKTKLVN